MKVQLSMKIQLRLIIHLMPRHRCS